jgi:hypothetical protein
MVYVPEGTWREALAVVIVVEYPFVDVIDTFTGVPAGGPVIWTSRVPVPVGPITAIVTVFEVTPPMEIATGTALPASAVAGTRALTWYSPTKPGARPENRTLADTPPMVTVGVVRVSARGVLVGAGKPVWG